MFVTVQQLFAVLKKRRLWQAVVFQNYGSVGIGKYKVAPAHNTAVTAEVFTAEPLYEFAGPCDVSQGFLSRRDAKIVLSGIVDSRPVCDEVKPRWTCDGDTLHQSSNRFGPPEEENSYGGAYHASEATPRQP